MSAVSERAAIVALVAGQLGVATAGLSPRAPGVHAKDLVDSADAIVEEAMRRHPVEADGE